jgi:hypothetical protein
MERLFSPCTRLHDIYDLLVFSPGRLQELNLDASIEELLSAESAFTYADLYAMLGNSETTVWLTPHGAVARERGMVHRSWVKLHYTYRFSFNTNEEQNMVAWARHPESLLEICDVVLRLLAASAVHSVILQCHDDGVLISPPTMAHLMYQCKSLKLLSLNNMEIGENLCRVLGTYSRPDLDIVLKRCNLTSAGTSALVESLRRDQGPTKLAYCHLDYSALADGLRRNRRLKSLKSSTYFRSDGVSNEEFLAIAGALKENEGLVDVELNYSFTMSDETCDVLCDSLKTHPTLQILKLLPIHQPLDRRALTPAVLMYQMQSLVDMLKVNMSIHTIHLHDRYTEHELYRESIIPYLEANRVRAIQRTSPIEYRAKLLGLALLSARADANRFWALLSGNAEVAFPSSTNTMTTTLAANHTLRMIDR